MTGSSDALPSAPRRRRMTLLAVLLATFAVCGAPAAQAVAASPAAVTPGPKGASTGPSTATVTPGTTQRSARSTRTTTGSARGTATRAAVGAQTATAPGAAAPVHLVAWSTGPSPDRAHHLLLAQPAVPPHTAAPAPPITPLLSAIVVVPLPAGRLLTVAPGRSPPSDPRRA